MSIPITILSGSEPPSFGKSRKRHGKRRGNLAALAKGRCVRKKMAAGHGKSKARTMCGLPARKK